MAGQTGDDTYVLTSLEDCIVEQAGEGVDTVESSITYSLGANFENLRLTGGADIDGYGNDEDNVLTGNDGNNLLDGGLGADTLIGGAGNDTYQTESAGDVVIENVGQGDDTEIRGYDSSAELADAVENLVLGAAVVHGVGNSLDNVLQGNDANNILEALGGNDTLIGGAGADRMEGGTGDDTYVVDDAGDEIVVSWRVKAPIPLRPILASAWAITSKMLF